MAKQKNKIRLANLPNSLYILVVVFLVAAAVVPKFLSPGNLTTLLYQASTMIVLSMAMALSLMMGTIDLSLGGQVSLTGVVMALLIRSGVNGWLAILCGLCCGVLFGAINGFVVGKMRVASFIGTFAVGNIAQSIANTLADSRTVSWGKDNHVLAVEALGSKVFNLRFYEGPTGSFTIFMPVVITAIIVVLILLAFNKTKLGSNVYAIGANEETARLSGIGTFHWRVGVFMLGGFLAALGGMIIMIRTNCMQPTSGDGLALQAVVAAVLGGNIMTGGKGSIPGAILGTLTLYVIRNAMTLYGIDTSAIQVVIGVILVLGMVLNQIVNSNSRKESRLPWLKKAEGGNKTKC